jgi:hypothetical protein
VKFEYQLQITTQKSLYLHNKAIKHILLQRENYILQKVALYSIETSVHISHQVLRMKKVQVLQVRCRFVTPVHCLLLAKRAATERFTITHARDMRAQRGITVHVISWKGRLIVLCRTDHVGKITTYSNTNKGTIKRKYTSIVINSGSTDIFWASATSLVLIPYTVGKNLPVWRRVRIPPLQP